MVIAMRVRVSLLDTALSLIGSHHSTCVVGSKGPIWTKLPDDMRVHLKRGKNFGMVVFWELCQFSSLTEWNQRFMTKFLTDFTPNVDFEETV